MINKVYLQLLRRRGHVECSACRLPYFLLLIVPALPVDLFAGQMIPGEGQTGLFYTVTHLHSAAYFILFFVFVLSVVNLIFQFGISRLTRPVSFLFSFFHRDSGVSEGPPVLKGLKRSRIRTSTLKPDGQARRVDSNLAPRDQAVISVRKMEKSDQTPAVTVTPTPLEGVNHSLPILAEPSSRQSGDPRVRGSQPDQKTSVSEFRFSSAVDMPTPEEMERREKSHLVVTGSVLGADGKGVPSAIVYLTDEEGNRVGQSCRTMPETGEFKVLISEPGKYRINGYKRGFVMEQSEPPQLPIESGKIEGFNLRMIPEGCVVSGRVVRDGSSEGIPGHEVSCVCRVDNYSRTAKTNAEGEFRISGVPVNSECFLEVRGEGGTLRITTDTFQTVQKKEIYTEIKVADSDLESPEELQDCPETDEATLEEEESVAMSEQQVDSDVAADQSENSELLTSGGPSAPPAP